MKKCSLSLSEKCVAVCFHGSAGAHPFLSLDTALVRSQWLQRPLLYLALSVSSGICSLAATLASPEGFERGPSCLSSACCCQELYRHLWGLTLASVFGQLPSTPSDLATLNSFKLGGPGQAALASIQVSPFLYTAKHSKGSWHLLGTFPWFLGWNRFSYF